VRTDGLQAQTISLQAIGRGTGIACRPVGFAPLIGIARIFEIHRLAALTGVVGVGVAAAPGSVAPLSGKSGPLKACSHQKDGAPCGDS
jgi:hypothetical protein